MEQGFALSPKAAEYSGVGLLDVARRPDKEDPVFMFPHLLLVQHDEAGRDVVAIEQL